jgi:hypothetical protein
MKYDLKPQAPHSVEATEFTQEMFDAGLKDPKAKGYRPWPKGVQRGAVVIDGHTTVKLFMMGPDGPQYFGPGDYLVVDPEKKVFPVDKDRFEASYEPAMKAASAE